MLNKTHVGDCRKLLAEFAAAGLRVQTCVTSPPYFGLRDYGHDGQIGLEPSPSEYVQELVTVFRSVRDVLSDDGTLWLNLGDSYAGSTMTGGDTGINQSGGQEGFKLKRQFKRKTRLPEGVKAKDLMGIPWRVAFALQSDGWYLRSDIIWHKPNPMPESVSDRPTKAHEYLFLLAKSERYYFDAASIAEVASYEGPPKPGKQAQTAYTGLPVHAGQLGTSDGTRNRRSVWTVATQPFSGAHFATFPRALIEPCVLAGSRPGDTVLDPFMGSGTTAQVATDLGRQFIGCELNPKYLELHEMRRTTTGMAI